jgi:hypothetical protein
MSVLYLLAAIFYHTANTCIPPAVSVTAWDAGVSLLFFIVESATLDVKSARTLNLSRCPINNVFAREDSAWPRRYTQWRA